MLITRHRRQRTITLDDVDYAIKDLALTIAKSAGSIPEQKCRAPKSKSPEEWVRLDKSEESDCLVFDYATVHRVLNMISKEVDTKTKLGVTPPKPVRWTKLAVQKVQVYLESFLKQVFHHCVLMIAHDIHPTIETHTLYPRTVQMVIQLMHIYESASIRRRLG